MGYRGELWVNDTPVSADWKVNVGRNFMILDKMIKLGILSKKEFDKFEHTPEEKFNASIELTKKDTAKLIDDILEPIVKKLKEQRTAEYYNITKWEYETTDLAYFTRIIRLLRTAMKRKGKINLWFLHG